MTQVSSQTTIATLLTAQGRSAIATVLISGPLATKVIDQYYFPLSKRKASELPHAQISVGNWKNSATDQGEELVVSRISEDRYEVHCHGGLAASKKILNQLILGGCQEVTWQAWSLKSNDDPIVSAAQIALADAMTVRTSKILLDQYHGALSGELKEILALLEANQIEEAKQRVSQLWEFRQLGLHLAQPWQLVLAGHANVGKSSLINQLLGYQRAIVFDQPGTTRDVVTASTAMDGWPVHLSDTAGLRATSESIEQSGIQKAKSSIELADVLMLVFDCSESWTTEDAELLQTYPDALVIHNKCDLRITDDSAVRPPGIDTSTETGEGIETLMQQLVKTMVPKLPVPKQAMLFTPAQVDTIQKAHHFIAQSEVTQAIQQIESMFVAESIEA
jgi:tRNA modification GTPase